MPSFSYDITDSEGRSKKGVIDAETMAQASAQLKSGGNIVLSIEEASWADEMGSKEIGAKKPSPKDLSVFCRQFVSIVEAGVPVISALAMLYEQTENKMLKDAIEGSRKGIEQGDTFSSMMAKYPKVFPMMFVTMVKAGEASGSIEVSFTRMAVQFEKESKLKSTIKKAAIYPSCIAVVAIVVVIGMLVFIVPTFESIFADMGSELPALTIWVMDASEYMQEKWYVVVGVMVAMFIGLKLFLKTSTGETLVSTLTIRTPVVKNLVIKTASARMARTLSTLLGSGLAIIDAIHITADIMSNLFFRSALHKVAEGVSMGTPMNECLHNTGLFPPLVHYMVAIGEETGGTEKMLDTLADYYEEEVEAATESLMTLLEPVTIIVLAGICGVIIGAVMMPMAQLYNDLGDI